MDKKTNITAIILLLFSYAASAGTGTSEAATVSYKFQKSSCDNVICNGSSTCNQTALPGSTPSGTYISTVWDWETDYIAGVNWASCTYAPVNGTSCEASSLQDAMFTPTFPKDMSLSEISVDVRASFEANAANYISNPPKLWVNLFDMDPDASCPPFEGGTLIGSSAQLDWPYGRSVLGTLNLPLTGISYAITAGHRIRIDLYTTKGYTHVGFPTYGVIRFGGNNQTQLNITQTSDEVTIVGPGMDPPDAHVGPGSLPTALDSFTLQSSGGSDLIGEIKVALVPDGSYNYIDSLSITNNDGTITYGSVSSPSSDTISITLTTPIDVTTSSSQYKLWVSPKQHSAMPAVPGGSYPIQGSVTAITSFYNNTAIDDAPTTLLTVDNLSPGNPSWGDNTASENQIALNWTNPGDQDFDRVLILRSTSTIVNAPVEGATYAQGDVIGSSLVRYAGNLQSFVDTGLTNGTDYYYRIFAVDTSGNYSSGVSTGPHQPNLVITIGNGSDPVDSLAAPGTTFVLDSFTVVLSDYQAINIPSITVGFSSGASLYLNTVEITSDDGGYVKGSVTGPFSSDEITIPVTSMWAGIPASSYKVKVTTKSNASLPPPPGSLYTLTGSVTAVSSASFTNKSYGDTSSSSVSIDNLSPGNPAWGTYWIEDGGLSIHWTNPSDPDFSEVLILRDTSPVADAPTEGVNYFENNYIGTSKIVHRGGSLVIYDWGLTNGQDYYYRIFAKDTSGNYSSGAAIGPLQPNINFYVGDGAGPLPNRRICPGCSDTLDAFSLQTNSGSADVTGLIFSFSPGVATLLSDVSLYSSDSSHLDSIPNPSSDTIVFSVNIPVTTTKKYYYVKVTSKSHGSLSQGDFDITGVISAVTTVENIHKTYADTTSATVTIDNLPPADPVWGVVTPLDRKIVLSWTNPANADFNRVLILRNTSPIEESPTDGTGYYAGYSVGTSKVVYCDTAQTIADINLTNGTDYYYKIFALDRYGNYSSGTAVGPYKPLATDITASMSATASVQGATGISINMNYSDDANANNSYTVDYKLSSSGTWTNWVTNAAHIASPYSTSITGLSPGIYDVRMTFNDPDGYLGSNQITTTAIDLLTPNKTAAGITSVSSGSSSGLTVNMNYSDDANANNSYTVDYKLSSSGTWTNWVTNAAHTASPYSTSITGLSPGIYDLRMTFNDPEGVSGTNPQTVTAIDLTGPMTTPAVVTATGGILKLFVNTPFYDDSNNNNSCQVEYKISWSGVWDNWGVQSCRVSPVALTVLTPDPYDVRVTYQDPDGVSGNAVQIINSVLPQSAKLIHNSETTGSSYWAPMGWGVVGGMYGEFTCETCHMKNSPNISRIKDMIELEGVPPRQVTFWSRRGLDSYGDDSEPRFMPMTSRICEVCHTMTNGLQNTPLDDPQIFGPIHQYEQPEPANHFNANGKGNCICCHTHETGFAIPQFLNPNCAE